MATDPEAGVRRDEDVSRYLTQAQKEAVVAVARQWPKTLTPKLLVQHLDILARQVARESHGEIDALREQVRALRAALEWQRRTWLLLMGAPATVPALRQLAEERAEQARAVLTATEE